MRNSMKVSLKIGILAAVLTMALNASLSAQTRLPAISSIGTGYTHLAAFSSPALGSACYLGYNTSDGTTEIGTVTSIAVTMMSMPSGLAGWTQITPFNIGTTPFYVAYNSTNGRYQVNEVALDCSKTTLLFDSGQNPYHIPGLFPNLTHVVAVQIANNPPLLMTYNSSASDVSFYGIDTSTWNLVPNSSMTLGQGYTILMPYYVNNLFNFIAYNGATGSNGYVEFLLAGFSPSLKTVYTNDWGSTWADLVPNLDPTAQEFFGYSHVDPITLDTSQGRGVVDSISVLSGGNETAQNVPGTWQVWPNSVSLFAPYYFKKVDSSAISPGFLVYYQSDGDIQVWQF